MSVYNGSGGYLGHAARITEPIAFVGGVTYQGSSTASITGINLTTLVGGLDSAPRKGDLVVVSFAVASTADRALSCSGNISGAYTNAITEIYQVAATTYDTNLECYYMIMDDTPDTSLTMASTNTSAQDGWSIAIHVWRYVDKATPLDVTSTQTSASGSALADPPAITPVTAGAVVLVVGAAAHATGASYFASPEDAQLTFFTTGVNSTNDITIGMGSYREWVSGSYNPTAFRFTATNPTNGSWAAATIAIRPGNNKLGSTGIYNVMSHYNDSIRYL